MKKIIGLTGSFGSGKTTVAHSFQALGANVIDADVLAHEALMAGSEVFDLIVKLFGKEIIGDDGHINRRKVSELVFHDSVKRKALEEIIHPYVFERMEEEIRESEEAIVILDVPLLFETGLDQRCDQTLVVTAPEETILKRLREKGFSEPEIKARLSAQKPQEEKALLADFVIENKGSFEDAQKQVHDIWTALMSSDKPQSPKGN